MASIITNRQIGLAAAFTVLAWLGEYVHFLSCPFIPNKV
jgi:hypothetical protein